LRYFFVKKLPGYFKEAGFALEIIDERNPFGFEISDERIFAIGRKV